MLVDNLPIDEVVASKEIRRDRRPERFDFFSDFHFRCEGSLSACLRIPCCLIFADGLLIRSGGEGDIAKAERPWLQFVDHRFRGQLYCTPRSSEGQLTANSGY